MKLTSEARQTINETMAEIHEDGRPSREIAARLVTAMTAQLAPHIRIRVRFPEAVR